MSSSEAGKAAHTPGIPNTALSTSEQATMATMPRQMEVMEASVTSICRGMVAIVACSLLLSAVFGMLGVWAAFPASELLTALLTLFLLRRKKAETA